MHSYTFSKEELYGTKTFYSDDEYDYIFNMLRKLVEKERKEVSPEYKNIKDYKFVIGENVARVLHLSKPDRIFDFEVIYESSYVFEPNSVDFGIVDTDVAATINEANRIKYNKMYVKKEDKKMDIKLYECRTFVGGIVTKPQDLIKNVIFSGPCTIVQWTDGDKTIVRCENEDFDPEKGLAMAIVKKLFGTNESKTNYNDIFKKWIQEEGVPEFLNKKMNVSEDKKYHTVKDTIYMTVKQYANMTGMSKSTIIRQINGGKIFGAKKDKTGKWLIPIGEV